MGALRNDGPFHYKSLLTRSSATNNLEGISAGLSFPGQNLHESLSVRLWISSTRFWTYDFHWRSFLIQHSVVNESVQQKDWVSKGSELNCCCTVLRSLAKIVAPRCSSLGIVYFFIGDTLAFDATILTSTESPSEYSIRAA